MPINAVIRCSSCNRISPKFGSKDNKCKWCLEIEKLKTQIEHLKKDYWEILEGKS